MKKSAAVIALITSALLLTQIVFAQDATSTGVSRKEKVQQRIDTRKENVQARIEAMREKMASREAALKERLAKFRDQKKAEVTERISTNLNRINQNMTERMLKFLDNATRILNKLEKRVNEGSPDVKDVTAAKAAIAEAKAAIDSAKAVVSAQAEKDYTVTVTSEGKVRTDVKKVRDVLHADLKAAREAVIKAKQAVGNALRVAKSGKIEVPKEGTPSGQ